MRTSVAATLLGAAAACLMPQAAGAMPPAQPVGASASSAVPAVDSRLIPPTRRDRTPPGMVADLSAGPVTSTTARLTWANPPDEDLTEVVVRRAEGGVAPSNPRRGTAVALPEPTATAVTDEGLSASTIYSWAVFTRDDAGNTSAAASATARTAAESPGVGYDVSWPQCGAPALPASQAFAIVGVNGGLANTTNPCLAEQLQWAQGSTGITSQPGVALYVNTANPAELATSWPQSNEYPAGAAVANPYGACVPGDYGAACAFMYGYARAYDDATIRGVPDPESHFWWLDVELENTWQEDTVANRAVLEGMTHYLLDVLGAEGVGIYATTYQWRTIVGEVGLVTTAAGTPSALNGLPSWIAGATSLAGAQDACSGTPLTGGEITVTQYVLNDLDHNWACTS